MKKLSALRRSQSGIAHLGLILASLVVIVAVGFAAQRVINSNTGLSAEEVADIELEEASEDTEIEVNESEDWVGAEGSTQDFEENEEDEAELES